MAFYDCDKLKTIRIGSSVRFAESDSFSYSTSVDTVYLLPYTPPNFGFNGNWDKHITAYVPKGHLEEYMWSGYWNEYVDFIEMGQLLFYPNKQSSTIEVGDSDFFYFEKFKDDDVEMVSGYWESQNPDIATVDDEGNVCAVSEGHTIIYYKVKDSYGRDYNYPIVVDVVKKLLMLRRFLL